MSKRQILMLIGVWVIIFQLLGFYANWDKFFALVTGVLIIGIAYTLKPENKHSEIRNSYVEHKSDHDRPKQADSGTDLKNQKIDHDITPEIPDPIDITNSSSTNTQ